MITLTVTAKGQVTLRREVLKHLGVQPGEKIAVDLLPDGKASLKVARPAGSISDFVGLLAGRQRQGRRSRKSARTAQGWSGKA